MKLQDGKPVNKTIENLKADARGARGMDEQKIYTQQAKSPLTFFDSSENSLDSVSANLSAVALSGPKK